jgi:hypothetical protein
MSRFLPIEGRRGRVCQVRQPQRCRKLREVKTQLFTGNSRMGTLLLASCNLPRGGTRPLGRADEKPCR